MHKQSHITLSIPASRPHLQLITMDIESEYRKRKILKAGGDYNLEWCRWRVMGALPKKKKEIYNPNPKGYIHTACILKNTLYAFFGPDENKPTASMHSYSFKTSEWKEWTDCDLPEARDSFGLTVHQNEIFMFGGSSFDMQFGDLQAFNTLTCSWKRIETDLAPSPRNPLVFTDLNGEAILLYGGINLESGTILNDAFAYKAGAWTQIGRILKAPLNLIGAKHATILGKPYLFGGEYTNGTGTTFPSTSLYRIDVNLPRKFIEFVQIECRGPTPCARTAHAMASVGEDYVIVVGGQSIGENRMLRDVWLLDVECAEWVKISPANGPIRPLADNTLLLHGSSLLLLGGLTEHDNMWNEQILTIQFGESEPYRNEICSNCLQRSAAKDKDDKAFPKTVVLSSGFFYTVSLEIKHPFQAIQILSDCADFMKATRFDISVEKSLNENEHIEIEWDGQTLSKEQFEGFICHAATCDEAFSRFTTSLKVASLRLGKTFIFLTADDTERKVFMFSADSKVTPAFDETYGYFAYVENIRKNRIESHEGKAHKELILNVLRSRVADPEKALLATNSHRLLIFEKNILVTSDRVYYYELIATLSDDISFYKSAKKVQFLDDMGYEISKEPELSLRSYLSLLRLERPSLSLSIGRRQTLVPPTDYAERLRSMEAEGRITAFEMPSKIHDIEVESVLYIANRDDVVAGNLGLLVYLEGKLVNRLGDSFGELFKEQFYKTKFKRATTVFEYLGVLNVKRGLALNYFANWFKKNRNYYSFLDTLRAAMRKARAEKLERQLADDPKAKRKQ